MSEAATMCAWKLVWLLVWNTQAGWQPQIGQAIYYVLPRGKLSWLSPLWPLWQSSSVPPRLKETGTEGDKACWLYRPLYLSEWVSGLTTLFLKIASGPIDTLGFSCVAWGAWCSWDYSLKGTVPSYPGYACVHGQLFTVKTAISSCIFPTSLTCLGFLRYPLIVDAGAVVTWMVPLFWTHSSLFILIISQELKEWDSCRATVHAVKATCLLGFSADTHLVLVWTC